MPRYEVIELQSASSEIDIAVNKTKTNIYYVSNQGSDSNDGLTTESPFQTVAKLMTVLQNNDMVKIACNSIFYEPFEISTSNNIITSYGAGRNPVFDGSSVISTPVPVSGNVYETTNVYTGRRGRPVMFEKGVPMQPVSNIQECEALPNSYVAESGDSFSAGTYTVRFHTRESDNPNDRISDFTTNTRQCVHTADGANKVELSNVDSQYGFSETTHSFDIGENNSISNCVARYGNKHNAFVSKGGYGRDIICYGAELQGQYGRTATLFVAYASNPSGSSYTWKDCSGINRNKKAGRKLGNRLTGFLDHGGGGNQFGEADILGCYLYGCDVPFSSNADTTNIINCYFEEITGQVINNQALTTNIKNSFFHSLRGTDSATENNNCNISDSCLIKLKYATCRGDLNFQNTLFYNEPKIDGYETISLFPESNLPNSLRMSNCIVYNYTFVCGVSGTDYVGDYNIFFQPNGVSIRAYYNGTQYYNNLTQWQNDTGQDLNSVYLTVEQAKSFFKSDPATGIVTINPFAEVTGSDGTVYTGTYADGTRISEKFNNKNYSDLKAKYVDDLELLQYRN